MGKWNRRNYVRPRWRNYRDYNWSPPREEPCPDPETEVWNDDVPMWEKKFCYLVGRMPWKKVLSTRNFMHCHNNILSWDDSAGEEAFVNAKKRFWDEFNGVPSEAEPSNPDLYNDEIDWNPCIDPELARELDWVYFNPDDKYNLPTPYCPKANNECPEKTNDPWESGHRQSCAVQDKATGWNNWDDSVDDTSKITKNNNPWENHHVQATEIKDDSWGGGWNKSWDSKRNEFTDTSKNRRIDGNSYNGKDSGWQDRGACSNQISGKSFKPNYQNSSYWSENNRVRNNSGNSWGKQRRDNYSSEVKGTGNGYRGRGRGRYDSGCRKRESPDWHAVSHKRPSTQGADSQSPPYWNTDNNKRVSFRSQWS